MKRNFPRRGFLASERGQESAVFEVLIAVIIMSFVLVVGFNALNVLSQKVCEGKLSQNLEQIRSAIEEVVNTKNKGNVYFELPECYSDTGSKLLIVESDSQAQCSAVCGGTVGRCTLLVFSSDKYSENKCLRVSSATTFPDGEPCDPNILEPSGAYELVNWKSSSGISEGTYTLFKVSSLSSERPEICAFKRK
ncbi:Uncharacterised protein [uncultured archaeon]|nr:Uncharacterised protein [uncultured archaeon]